MRALLIAPYMFPHENPRAHRWTELGAALCERGWTLDVVTSKAPGHEQVEQHRGMTLYRRGHHSLKSFLARPGDTSGSGSGGSLARWFNRYFVRSWYWPDDAWIWKRPALKQARVLLQAERYDVLISVALPFTAHWVAWRLSKEFPGMRWLADTGDPFSLQPMHPLNNEFFYRAMNLWAEREIVRRATLFTVPTKAMLGLYKETWPKLAAKLEILPPVCTMPVISEVQPRASLEDSGAIRIGNFGSFYPGVREPEPLLRSVWRTSKLLDLELHLFGTPYPGWSALLQELQGHSLRIQERGLLPRAAVPAAMADMDVLLLQGNRHGIQLPSKIVDYLASGRPILHVQQDEDDPILEYLEGHPLACTVNILDWDEEEERVVQFLRSCRGQLVPEAWRQARLQHHSPGALAGRLEVMVQRTVGK
jgi:hypothetical protein